METGDRERNRVKGDVEGIWQTLKMGLLNATDRCVGGQKASLGIK